MNELELYKESCTNLANAFAKKHGITFKYWLGDMPMLGYFLVNNMPMTLEVSLIFLDLHNKYPTGLIVEWFDYSVKKTMIGKDFLDFIAFVNEKLGIRK